MYQPAMQVKQYIAVVQNERGMRFMVFATKDPKSYLFAQLDESGCATGLQIPVRKADLQPNIKSALAHGWGNASL
jgi:hypothetical protein